MEDRLGAIRELDVLQSCVDHGVLDIRVARGTPDRRCVHDIVRPLRPPACRSM